MTNDKAVDPGTDAVINAYMNYHSMELDNEGILRRVEKTCWALDFVSDLVYEDPSRCWTLLRDIAKRRPASDAMISLGVTLGSLLREQPTLMNLIENDIESDKSLSELMSYVMEDETISTDIWLRIEAISKKT
jgi:hypothetical protein